MPPKLILTYRRRDMLQFSLISLAVASVPSILTPSPAEAALLQFPASDLRNTYYLVRLLQTTTLIAVCSIIGCNHSQQHCCKAALNIRIVSFKKEIPECRVSYHRWEIFQCLINFSKCGVVQSYPFTGSLQLVEIVHHYCRCNTDSYRQENNIQAKIP